MPLPQVLHGEQCSKILLYYSKQIRSNEIQALRRQQTSYDISTLIGPSSSFADLEQWVLNAVRMQKKWRSNKETQIENGFFWSWLPLGKLDVPSRCCLDMSWVSNFSIDFTGDDGYREIKSKWPSIWDITLSQEIYPLLLHRFKKR